MTLTLFVTMLLGIGFGAPAPQITATSPQLEGRDQPVTADDVAILVRAEALLGDSAVWNRSDERECKDDEAAGKRSLFCALQKACIDVLGSYDHRRVALQEVRFAVEEATRGRDFQHRLRDFNNLPETRLEDIKRVLAVAKERVSARLKATAGLSQPASDEQQIRAVRAGFNAAIARHDVPTILSFLEEEFRVATSAGGFFNSRQEMGNAFTRTFAEFKDALYVRTPDAVEVSANGASASETGRWVGTWTTPSGPFRTGGRYSAYWRKANGRWLLHAEMYVPLHCEGTGCR